MIEKKYVWLEIFKRLNQKLGMAKHCWRWPHKTHFSAFLEFNHSHWF